MRKFERCQKKAESQSVQNCLDLIPKVFLVEKEAIHLGPAGGKRHETGRKGRKDFQTVVFQGQQLCGCWFSYFHELQGCLLRNVAQFCTSPHFFSNLLYFYEKLPRVYLREAPCLKHRPVPTLFSNQPGPDGKIASQYRKSPILALITVLLCSLICESSKL